MKKQRQAKIIELIEKNDIINQEQLKTCLESEGFTATQATLSRDINELKLKKELNASGLYIYVKRKTVVICPPLFKDAILDIRSAMNTVVIKCGTGMAQAVCATLDKMNYPEIVGTISGDDTIFALTQSEPDAVSTVEELRELMR
ncbi:MAG: ArgR family transcriptional regulator [Oscillospiraceae bacterium]|nr:ArgR family transcriptional regulator [Oscillospiraceae bacterium]